MRRCPLAFTFVTALLASVVLASGASGADFQVNTYTNSNQLYPAVARAANGAFVVVWESQGPDGGGYGIFGQRFESSGARSGGEFLVNSRTLDWQRIPAVSSSPSGDFVVVWRGGGAQDGSGYGVFGQRFASSGARLGSEFLVNEQTGFDQGSPAVSVDDQGEFVVAWQSVGSSIVARRFDSTGAALGGDFLVNTFTLYTNREPAVATDADGDFVVTWDGQTLDGSSYGIFARRFDSSGAPSALPFQVNTYTTFGQIFSTIGADDEGAFVISWQSSQDGSGYGVFARRFNSVGAPLALEFQVSLRTTGDQTFPSLDVDGDGAFLVTWTESARDGSFAGVFGRRFDAAGTASSDFQVNSYTLDEQRKPSVALGDDGGYVVAWESAQQDGFGFGIFASRVPGLAPLDVDGDGAVAALTDGLLFLRDSFGFSDSALTNGVVGSGCTRCSASAIAAHIDSLGSQLDVDDDGEIQPLTDSILVLRHRFGFSGGTLISGAVDSDCNRCGADQIKAYLDSLILPPNPI